MQTQIKHTPTANQGSTYIGRFKFIDDRCFAAVVQAKAQNVNLLFLQPKPSCQLVKQSHGCGWKSQGSPAVQRIRAFGKALHAGQRWHRGWAWGWAASHLGAMVWAGPYTNTVPGAALHISTWRVSWLQPGYQSRLAVYSPVYITRCPWFTGKKMFWAAQTGAQSSATRAPTKLSKNKRRVIIFTSHCQQYTFQTAKQYFPSSAHAT